MIFDPIWRWYYLIAPIVDPLYSAVYPRHVHQLQLPMQSSLFLLAPELAECVVSWSYDAPAKESTKDLRHA